MGLTTCITIISVNQENIEVYDIPELSNPKINVLRSLNPQYLSISGISNNSIVIFWEGILKSMSTKDENNLTEIENQIFDTFPRSLVLTLIISDTVNLRYFSLIENKKIVRIKGTLNGKIVEDQGSLLKVEKKLADLLNESLIKKTGNDILNKFKELKPDYQQDDVYKMFLIYLSKIEYSSDYDYKTGSLDEYISDSFFEKLTNEDILDYSQNSKFAVFPIRKWNNTRNCLGDYIMKALYCLLLKNEIREVKVQA